MLDMRAYEILDYNKMVERVHHKGIVPMKDNSNS